MRRIMDEFIVATIDGNTTTYTWDEFYTATWNPSVKCEFVVIGRLHGKTYKEKQIDLRTRAIKFQWLDEGGLSWGELAEIRAYFEEYGKRFGLLREFRENEIC